MIMAKRGKKALCSGDRIHVAFPPVKQYMLDKVQRVNNLSKWITETVEYLYGSKNNSSVFSDIGNDIDGANRNSLCYRIPLKISPQALDAIQKDRYAVIRDSILFLVGILQTVDLGPIDIEETRNVSASVNEGPKEQDDLDKTDMCNLNVLMNNYMNIMSI